MNIATCAQMREADRLASSQIGIPEIVLMENAALKSVEEIIKDCNDVYNKDIIIFAGYGNNGGDALACARHLYTKGANVKVKMVPSRSGKMSSNTEINFSAAKNMTIDIEDINSENLSKIGREIKDSDIIVDGMFGTGIDREVSGLVSEYIDEINSSTNKVYSLDIPSGINGDTGQIYGKCVKASKTLTFGLPKVGLYMYPGSQYCGEIVVSDIGIPKNVYSQVGIDLKLVSTKDIKIPERKSESSKFTYGKVLFIGGSNGMAGSVTLSSTSSLKTGAGLVYLGAPKSIADILASKLTEIIVIPLEDENKGVLSEKALDTVKENYEKASLIAVGPGLSKSAGVDSVVSWVIENSPVPIVLDADGLNSISQNLKVLKKAKSPIIITPHAGEMARLIDNTVEYVQNNRLEVARKFAKDWNVFVVLKGANTIIATPEGCDYINSTGNNGMATAGSGDVLTGTIAGLIAQDLEAVEAAVTGVYLHGLAGDMTAEEKGFHGMTAGDIVEKLPYAIKDVCARLGLKTN